MSDKSNSISLIVVTKNQPQEVLMQLLSSKSTTDLGESRWQDFKRRFVDSELYEKLHSKKIKFHFIGHLQSNKIRHIVRYFDMIQSVDSLEILQKINVEAEKIGEVQNVLLEVNICADKSKYGLKPSEIKGMIESAANLPNIKIEGLMTILSLGLSEKERFEKFKELKALTTELNLKITSMGMSNDYKTAIKAGSNMIRIGRAIFDRKL